MHGITREALVAGKREGNDMRLLFAMSPSDIPLRHLDVNFTPGFARHWHGGGIGPISITRSITRFR